MTTEYSDEVKREGEDIRQLLAKRRDIIRGKGKLVAKKDAQKQLTEFMVEKFRELAEMKGHKVYEEVYEYLFLGGGMGMNETSLALLLPDAREMFDKGMDWEEFQKFIQNEQNEGRRLL